MSYERKGFTLIELLVVIAIIGILAAALLVSLGSARKTARDARRAADLRAVQNALELYYNKSASYPAQDNWNDMANAAGGAGIISAGVGVLTVSNDPSGGTATYRYCRSTASPANQSYILKTVLETDNTSLLSNDIDSTTGFSSPAACDAGSSLDCVDTSANFFYCVGL